MPSIHSTGAGAPQTSAAPTQPKPSRIQDTLDPKNNRKHADFLKNEKM